MTKQNNTEETSTKTKVDFTVQMNTITKKINEIDQEKYDVQGFVDELGYWVNDLYWFYNVIVKPGQDPSKIPFKIKPSLRPKEGQVAYFNLRRGYPKELYDGHYCYVLKDFGLKFLIIPTTSVKKDSSELNPNNEIKIEIKDFKNDYETRIQVSDIRVVDTQRFKPNKGVYDVLTEQSYIIQEIKRILF